MTEEHSELNSGVSARLVGGRTGISIDFFIKSKTRFLFLVYKSWYKVWWRNLNIILNCILNRAAVLIQDNTPMYLYRWPW